MVDYCIQKAFISTGFFSEIFFLAQGCAKIFMMLKTSRRLKRWLILSPLCGQTMGESTAIGFLQVNRLMVASRVFQHYFGPSFPLTYQCSVQNLLQQVVAKLTYFSQMILLLL